MNTVTPNTPGQLAKAIYKIVPKLLPDVRENLIRVYEKTWHIVLLHAEKLASPTINSYGRLLHLWYAAREEFEKLQ
jgi:hypothetical protein